MASDVIARFLADDMVREFLLERELPASIPAETLNYALATYESCSTAPQLDSTPIIDRIKHVTSSSNACTENGGVIQRFGKYNVGVDIFFILYKSNHRFACGFVGGPAPPPCPISVGKVISNRLVVDMETDSCVNFIWLSDGRVMVIVWLLTSELGDIDRSFVLFDKVSEISGLPENVLVRSSFKNQRKCAYCSVFGTFCACDEIFRAESVPRLKKFSVQLGWKSWVQRFLNIRCQKFSTTLTVDMKNESGNGFTTTTQLIEWNSKPSSSFALALCKTKFVQSLPGTNAVSIDSRYLSNDVNLLETKNEWNSNRNLKRKSNVLESKVMENGDLLYEAEASEEDESEHRVHVKMYKIY